jgi:phosphoserine phosphatase RsbX
VRGGAPRPKAQCVASGLVGRRRPPVKRQTLKLERGDVVVFATDGIRGSFVDSLLLVTSPQATAEHARDAQWKPTNEGLVLVVCHLR